VAIVPSTIVLRRESSNRREAIWDVIGSRRWRRRWRRRWHRFDIQPTEYFALMAPNKLMPLPANGTLLPPTETSVFLWLIFYVM